MPTFDVGASAEYHETGDMVIVTLYVLDPTPTPEYPEGVYTPQLVKTGTCTLLSGNSSIDTPVEFDRRSGTRDGNFQIFFIHPSSLHHLKVRIDMTIINGTTEDSYEYETQVNRIVAEDPGLEEQPWEDEVL